MQTRAAGLPSSDAPTRATPVRLRGGSLHSTPRVNFMLPMTEILFIVEESAEGGYTAHAVNASIVTEADSLEELREHVRDAVRCHFDDDDVDRPKLIRLHLVRDEIIAA